MAGSGSQPSVSNMWELSLYELHRKPHEMVVDNSAIAVSPRALHSELMCPICLDLMRNAQTTKECLHRFCQECIITALRSGNKECPTCRKKLVSKRSLRPDPNFDALIAKIYPDREEVNNQQEKYTPRRSLQIHQRKRKAPDSPPLGDDGDDEEEEPHPPSEKRVRQEQANSPESEPSTPRSNVESLDNDTTQNEVELQLRPHPNHPVVSDHAIRNLVTSPLCTISHLVKFLSINQLLEKDVQKHKGSAVRALTYNHTESEDGEEPEKSRYSLFVHRGTDDEDDYCLLSRGTPLRQIIDMYWITGDKLKLYFTKDQVEM